MKIHFSAESFELTPELEKYANAKVSSLAKRLPRKMRVVADCRFDFSQHRTKTVKFSTCSLTLAIGNTELRATETTQHMYAALDIAAVHIEQQIKDYLSRKESRLGARLRGHIRADWQPPNN